MTDGTQAELADVRAGIQYSQHYSIYTWGGFAQGGTSNKIKQFNVAGTHFATSGVFFHQGVKNAWSDPASFVLSDPYVRATGGPERSVAGGFGFAGWVARSGSRDQVRFAGFSGYYTDSITGGMTIEYGIFNWVQRFTDRVGNGMSVIRMSFDSRTGESRVPAPLIPRASESRRRPKQIFSKAIRTARDGRRRPATRPLRAVAGHLRQRPSAASGKGCALIRMATAFQTSSDSRTARTCRIAIGT
jgi:hypothetical protein